MGAKATLFATTARNKDPKSQAKGGLYSKLRPKSEVPVPQQTSESLP